MERERKHAQKQGEYGTRNDNENRETKRRISMRTIQ